MKTFQRKLFHHLHVLHGNDTAWKRACMELLQIGKSAFYKRMRGETPMMIGEIVTLARHFNLSVDQLLVENNSLFPFHFAGSIYRSFSAKNFFANLLDDFFLIKSKPQARLFIVARDLPLFYYLEAPSLLNFKIFTWEQTKPGRDVWSKNYHQVDWSREWQMTEHCTFLSNFFRSLPRTEIWADDFLQKTLRQVTYHLEHTDGFEIEEAVAVLKDLERVVAEMKRVVTKHYDTAVNGSREQIKVYANQNSEMQNILVVKWANQHSVHLPVDFPVYIKSHHQGITEYAIESCRLLAEQSHPFDKMTTEERVVWFDKQLDQVRSLRKSQVFVFS
jgi:hypothetical protein